LNRHAHSLCTSHAIFLLMYLNKNIEVTRVLVEHDELPYADYRKST
jgi:hypothetical protein